MRPTPSAVREAAEALKEAIDRHLFAVETRLGDNDVAVEIAYRDIQVATQRYDHLLLDAYDEVTPFEFPNVEQELGEFDELGLRRGDSYEIPPVVSICMRRDYAIVDPQLLLETGHEAYQAVREIGKEVYEDQPPQNVPTALFTMFQLAGVDGFENGSNQAGLENLGGAVWFLAADEPSLVDADTAFAEISEDKLIFKVQELPPPPEGDDDRDPYDGYPPSEDYPTGGYPHSGI